MASYKQVRDARGNINQGLILRVDDGALIPVAVGNRDYDAYVDWLDDGNTITPADPAPTTLEITATQRVQAVEQFLNDSAPLSKALRALIITAMDEINLLRQRDVDRSIDVAAATSLADLKTRWAARSALSDRTIAQLKTAVQNKINAGSAD